MLNDISNNELHAIAKAVEESGKVAELAEALEMVDYAGSSRTLLNRWLKEMTSMGTPVRRHLMHHLAGIGMPDLRAKLVSKHHLKLRTHLNAIV